MTENALWGLLLGHIHTGLAPVFPGLLVTRAFQPVPQGVSGPVLALHRVRSVQHGAAISAPEQDGNTIYRVTTRVLHDTFRAAVMDATQAQNPDAPTERDILDCLEDWLQAEETVSAFVAQGVGVFRPRGVEETVYENEQGQNALAATLDFVLGYTRQYRREIPVIERIERGIFRV